MKIRDEKEMQKPTKQTNKDRNEQGGGGKSYSERVIAQWFCCALKLGFLQLIYM